MKGVKARITKGLNVGDVIDIVDNSGVKKGKILTVKGYRGVKKRLTKGGIGDMIIVVVKSGKPDQLKQKMPAVIIRQRMPYRRSNGMRVKFESNAAIILKNEEGEPKGTMIKGPVAREAIERWPMIGKISKMVI